MIPIYEQVMDQIKKEIISGELEAGSALPSVRALSAELRISALTVKKTYDKLEEEGFVSTIHGKGTYVLGANQSFAIESRRRAVEEAFASAVEKAKEIGMTAEEIREIFEIMLED